jgi:hypothetical protein
MLVFTYDIDEYKIVSRLADMGTPMFLSEL